MTETTTDRLQVRFPGQAAAPEGPADMTITYLMHHGFRRDLAHFVAAVPRTPVEDRATWRALAERWDHLSVPMRLHHNEEDTYVWPFLRERAGAEDREMLETMEAEHADIDPALEACATGFARLAGHADDDARSALSVRVASVREALGRHLVHEEVDAFALLQRVTSAEEWDAMRKIFMAEVPFPTLLRVIPWSMHKVPADLREEVLRRAPVAQRVLWWATRSRFSRLDRRAFAYVP